MECGKCVCHSPIEVVWVYSCQSALFFRKCVFSKVAFPVWRLEHGGFKGPIEIRCRGKIFGIILSINGKKLAELTFFFFLMTKNKSEKMKVPGACSETKLVTTHRQKGIQLLASLHLVETMIEDL